MKSIVEESRVTFKELEKKIFVYVCKAAVEMTQIILEEYDRELHASRNTKEYRDKGCRTTTIKTVYGDVTYDRHVYQTTDEEGCKKYVYLLDEAVRMDKIGLISTNLAEKIASCVTENPYRVTADIISGTSGQTISHGGAWKLVQKLRERVSEEKELQVKQMNADETSGTREIKVLFEEMDGVWLRLQGKDHKSIAKQEMKVATIYEGWEKEDRRGSRLCGKKVIAGMEKSNEFHEKREVMQTVKRYAEPKIFNVRMMEIITTLSAAKAPKKDGKGNPYIDVINMHVPMRDAIQTASRRAFVKALL